MFDFANESNIEKDQTQKVDETYIRSKVNEYSQMNERDMMKKLMQEVQKSKQNGSFNYNELSAKLDSVKSYLTNEQLSKLENLLEKIR